MDSARHCTFAKLYTDDMLLPQQVEWVIIVHCSTDFCPSTTQHPVSCGRVLLSPPFVCAELHFY